MSSEQLSAFLEAVEADAGLQEKLFEAPSNADAVVGIAKAAGFVISAEDLVSAEDLLSAEDLAEAQAELPEEELSLELSLEELEGVAGGCENGFMDGSGWLTDRDIYQTGSKRVTRGKRGKWRKVTAIYRKHSTGLDVILTQVTYKGKTTFSYSYSYEKLQSYYKSLGWYQ